MDKYSEYVLMKQVTVVLDNGTSYEGDLLVGADGIWSKVPELNCPEIVSILLF